MKLASRGNDSRQLAKAGDLEGSGRQTSKGVKRLLTRKLSGVVEECHLFTDFAKVFQCVPRIGWFKPVSCGFDTAGIAGTHGTSRILDKPFGVVLDDNS